MKTRFAGFLGKTAIAAGLAAGLALGGGLGHVAAQQADENNYFVQHPGPVNGRTGIDPYDPYAPVGLGESVSTSADADNARKAAERSAASAGTTIEWSSSPRLPGQPY